MPSTLDGQTFQALPMAYYPTLLALPALEIDIILAGSTAHRSPAPSEDMRTEDISGYIPRHPVTVGYQQSVNILNIQILGRNRSRNI